MSCRLSAIHSYVATVNSIFQCRKNKINGAFLFGMLKEWEQCKLGHIFILIFQLIIQNDLLAACNVPQLEVVTDTTVKY